MKRDHAKVNNVAAYRRVLTHGESGAPMIITHAVAAGDDLGRGRNSITMVTNKRKRRE